MISSYIVSKAVEYEIISQNERALYELSLSTLFFSILTWGTLLILGGIQNCFWGCMIFIASYLPLRVFSGGLHLSTRIRCYFFSLVVFEAMITIHSYKLFASFAYNCCLLGSFPAIAIMAPEEDLKKPLYPNERTRNKKIVYLLLIVEATVLIALYCGKNTSAFFFVSFAPVLMLIQLVLGKLRNKALLLVKTKDKD